MKHPITSMLAAALLLVSGSSLAATPEQAIADALKQKLGLPAEAIAESPVTGLYEVITPQGIFYVTADGKKLVHGAIYDLDDGMTNLTEQRMSGVRQELLAKVSDTVIEFKAKDEKYVVNVFTDITCGYCRKLHDDMEAYNAMGITIRYLAFPRGGERSKSWTDMQDVWCAKDPRAAMTAAKGGGKVDHVTCADGKKVAEHYALGMTFGVNGTPAMVLDNGAMVPGYLPPERLLKTLQTQ
ncbi:bifunctional protein-disulfide isomerase/oxidoreductase DsbC [Ferrimonas balearica]|uniref:bifunctional protein-disulfide isomerase/oxidoreductase DsbC n=1 Tax=Ferrimonas balearica TaxID=44012 RepID=UPI001C99CFF3|nr:bifunctional protein-disulfide isomerase/oxidoreductase DsbC [Ferrimonas balearica]MBY5992470.1 bifunctional protein-disulfide isomerase/oxidoreductase DsbC [Ferrimonas balearica]